MMLTRIESLICSMNTDGFRTSGGRNHKDNQMGVILSKKRPSALLCLRAWTCKAGLVCRVGVI